MKNFKEAVQTLFTQQKLVMVIYPAISMRCYETGEYSPSRDGNMVYWSYKLSELSNIPIVMYIPNIGQEEYDRLKAMFPGDVTFRTHGFFGENIAETREKMSHVRRANPTEDDELLIVSEYEGIANADIYCFNASKKDADHRFDSIMPLMRKRVESGVPVFVHNQSQVLHLPGAIVDTRVVNYEVFMRHVRGFLLDSNTSIPKGCDVIYEKKCLLWPFRVSDKQYGLDARLDNMAGEHIIFTDPNNALMNDTVLIKKLYDNNIQWSIVKMDRAQFLMTLSVLSSVGDWRIEYHIDPDFEFHQSGIEASILAPKITKFKSGKHAHYYSKKYSYTPSEYLNNEL